MGLGRQKGYKMADEPTLLQRQAIGNMFDFITKSHNAQWGNYLFDTLEEWHLLPNSDISAYNYYSTLQNLPDWPKRIIVQIVLNGWNEHHDLLTLYDSINTLIALGVCGPSEYLLMHQVYNFIQYFRDLCDNDKDIILNEANINCYSLLFTKNGSMMNWRYAERLAVVDISMSKIDHAPLVIVAPTYFSFLRKLGLADDYEFDEWGKKELIIDKILPIVSNEFAKKHCHWIYTDYKIKYEDSPTKDAPLIVLSEIQYINNNI